MAALLLPQAAAAQPFDPLHPPNTYRNADNPYYWKNRPPREGYWQQDVHYRIKARLDEKTDVADGQVILTYWNNSPDTLRHVFFHLYQNAYNEGSYADLMEKGARAMPGRAGQGSPERGTEIRSMQVDGVELQRELDNTVMKAVLPRPLPPGGRTVFQYTFSTHWAQGSWRRMKLFTAWGHKHYDGTHWYPRISVYDSHMGWDTQQHLGHEFYGDFGTYDVELDMPNNMVLEATGWLQNPREVMPDDLRRKLDISNFKDKPWNEDPSVITPYDSLVRKVWRYHAENVHDFAWTADPTYRIGEVDRNGIKCVAMAQEPHAGKWQNAAAYCAKVIEAHSTWFGMYAYPKMVVADARDGMEYPMLTLDGGSDPNYRGLFVHEIGHNWFFGMVGNNETYRAMLDEGFTQFLTGWGLEAIDGDTMVEEPRKTAYARRYQPPGLAREEEVFDGYMRDAVRDRLPPINVHSDEYGWYQEQGLGGYGHVYSKTAVMLYNLQYVLGDTLFTRAMKHYFDQWKICHPTIEDFRRSIIQYTHVDLNWFFDQWIDTGKRIDYAVAGVKRRTRDEGQVIHLRREGSLQMPIDLRVTGRDGREYDYHIPNTWFTKKTDATVLPRWIGWDDLQRDYRAAVNIPSGIAEVRIDTTLRLADAYQPDNSLHPPVDIGFDHHLYNTPDRRTYEGFARPDIWWNGYDGVKAGVHFHGGYMRYKHKLWATAWLNTGFGQSLPPGPEGTSDTIPGDRDTRYDAMSFNVRYENGTEKLLRGSSIHLDVRHLDGLARYGGGFRWDMPDDKTVLRAEVSYLLRRDSTDLTYLLYPEEWEPDRLNASSTLALEHEYGRAHGGGTVEVRFTSPFVGAINTGQSVRLTVLDHQHLGGLQLRTRWIGQYGAGEFARESALFLAGASPEEMMENKYVRSVGFVPYDWVGAFAGEVNHFHQGGGLGLRGYAGYVAPVTSVDDGIIVTYRGNTGAALNAELDLDGLVRWEPGGFGRTVHLDVYLFGDVGSMGYRVTNADGVTHLELAPPRADAGLGAALTIKRWGNLVDIKPLTIRFDVPAVLSNLPAGEEEHFAFRYVVGIGRTF